MQTFGCQPQLLFVKRAVCNSVPQMHGLSLPVHRGNHKCQAPLSTVPHLSTNTQSGLRLSFRGVVSYSTTVPGTAAPQPTRRRSASYSHPLSRADLSKSMHAYLDFKKYRFLISQLESNWGRTAQLRGKEQLHYLGRVGLQSYKEGIPEASGHTLSGQ